MCTYYIGAQGKARQSYMRRLMLSMKKMVNLGGQNEYLVVMICMEIMTMIHSQKDQICYLLIRY
jgi:hypothetical protein